MVGVPGSIDPDISHHEVEILFLEFVRARAVFIPCDAQDADARSDDPYHRCDCVESDRKLLLQLCDQFRDRHRFDSDKEPEKFAPDAGSVTGEIGTQARFDDSPDLLWRSHTLSFSTFCI